MVLGFVVTVNGEQLIRPSEIPFGVCGAKFHRAS